FMARASRARLPTDVGPGQRGTPSRRPHVDRGDYGIVFRTPSSSKTSALEPPAVDVTVAIEFPPASTSGAAGWPARPLDVPGAGLYSRVDLFPEEGGFAMHRISLFAVILSCALPAVAAAVSTWTLGANVGLSILMASDGGSDLTALSLPP